MENLPKTCPFEVGNELIHDLNDPPPPITPPNPPPSPSKNSSKVGSAPITHLPGYPRIALQKDGDLRKFLYNDLVHKELERIAHKLWILTKQSSTSISALHRQKVKDREIIVTESPKMHLIWYHSRIFIKPIPKYLLSHQFWKTYLCEDKPDWPEQDIVFKAALGFLRTYAHLIRYESDFRIATDDKLLLLPKDTTWEQFCNFIQMVEKIEDDAVSPRYHYGEIRLSRLNLYAPLLLGSWDFQRVNPQYGDYFAQFYAPILFIFGVFSVVLSSMQLELAVEALNTDNSWGSYWLASRSFSLIVIGITALFLFWLSILWVHKFIKEWLYAIKDRLGRRGPKLNPGKEK